MTQIVDIKKYNDQMAKSMGDKLFFLNKISATDVDKIVDFGCANGELFKYVPSNWDLVGVDNNEEMKKQAIANFPKAKIVDNLNKVETTNNTLLNMSSVIHEVYSYCSKKEINEFWKSVFNSNYKYIVIRDMMISDITDRPLRKQDLNDIENMKNQTTFQDFEKVWGCKTYRNLIHYLLKYRYTENWERELHENYLPITLEQLLKKIPSDYEFIYLNRYTLPFIKNTVFETYGHTIRENTHAQIILKRKDA